MFWKKNKVITRNKKYTFDEKLRKSDIEWRRLVNEFNYRLEKAKKNDRIRYGAVRSLDCLEFKPLGEVEND